MIAWLALAFLWLPLPAAALEPELTPALTAGTREVGELQDYTRTQALTWVKEWFEIDLDAWSRIWKKRVEGVSRWQTQAAGIVEETLPLAGHPREAALIESAQLDVEQYDDILRLRTDPLDIPFALRFEAKGLFSGRKWGWKTRVFVPFSWKDELRADLSLPFQGRALGLQGLGLGGPWDLHTRYANRLGQAELESGVTATLMTDWSLTYDYHTRFGQGLDETAHWLRLSRGF